MPLHHRRHQPGTAELREVVGDRRGAEVEDLGELFDGVRAAGEEPHHLEAVAVGERLEEGEQDLVVGHVGLNSFRWISRCSFRKRYSCGLPMFPPPSNHFR